MIASLDYSRRVGRRNWQKAQLLYLLHTGVRNG
jgi:hypothetical protein